MTDAWSDEQIHYDGDSWNDVGTNLYGNFKQIYLLKKKHRHLKLLLSIGGWTYSSNFPVPASTPAGRDKFVSSSIELLENYGLDGLDIDWFVRLRFVPSQLGADPRCYREYPKDAQQAQHYVDLLKALREGLDRHAASKGLSVAQGYELTVAAVSRALALSADVADAFLASPADPTTTRSSRSRRWTSTSLSGTSWRALGLLLRSPLAHLSSRAGTTTPAPGILRPATKRLSLTTALPTPSPPTEQSSTTRRTASTPPSSSSVRPSSSSLSQPLTNSAGIPLYGRSFLHSNGPGTLYQGVGQGSWEAGVWDYKALPLPGSTAGYDPNLVAAWCHNPTTGEWVSYDSPEAAARKAKWIGEKGLGGAMYWELSGDRKGEGDIVTVVQRGMGRLDRRENHLGYEGSRFDNLRKGME